jgi:MFS family permease
VTVCPMYLAELSAAPVRGVFVGQHAISLVLGYTFAGWIGYGCYFATRISPSFAWRFPLLFQCLSPVLLLICSIWIPRSPRWLLSKGRSDDAWAVLRRLRSVPGSSDESMALKEFHEIREQIRLEEARLASTGHNSWLAAWTKKTYRKRMFLGFLTQWGAEFAGPLVIVGCYIFVIKSGELLTDEYFRIITL